MELDQPIRVERGNGKRLAAGLAREIIDKCEPKLLRSFIRRMDLSPSDAEQALELAAELLDPAEDDRMLKEYRLERQEMVAADIEDCLCRTDFIIPMGALNFLCEDYRRELRSVCAAAAELIAEERHGDLCCLIAGEYIEKRMRRLGSKLIAVHLVIDGEDASLYDGAHREITGKYSAWLPEEDRQRYSHCDLVLSAMVDIAPRTVYVYGGETNYRLLRRIQLMFPCVRTADGDF